MIVRSIRDSDKISRKKRQKTELLNTRVAGRYNKSTRRGQKTSEKIFRKARETRRTWIQSQWEKIPIFWRNNLAGTRNNRWRNETQQRKLKAILQLKPTTPSEKLKSFLGQYNILQKFNPIFQRKATEWDNYCTKIGLEVDRRRRGGF